MILMILYQGGILKYSQKNKSTSTHSVVYNIVISGFPGGDTINPLTDKLKVVFNDPSDDITKTEHIMAITITSPYAYNQLTNYITAAQTYYTKDASQLVEYAFFFDNDSEGNSNITSRVINRDCNNGVFK